MFPKTRCLLVASALIACALSTSAQSNRFGKINDEQWEIVECTFDSTAEALILFDVGKFEYEFHPCIPQNASRTELKPFSIVFCRHVRIKLLKDHEAPEAYVRIPLYLFPEGTRSLNTFHARLFTEKGNASKKVKYKREDLTESEVENGLVYLLKLENLPGGSILDIEFVMNSDYMFHIPDWSFSSKYPTLHSKISYSIPDFMDVTKQIENLDKLKVTTSTHPSQPPKTRNLNAGDYYLTPNPNPGFYHPFHFAYESYELNRINAYTDSSKFEIIKFHVGAANLSSISRSPETRWWYPIRGHFF